jgi:hypothetical protein
LPAWQNGLMSGKRTIPEPMILPPMLASRGKFGTSPRN